MKWCGLYVKHSSPRLSRVAASELQLSVNCPPLRDTQAQAQRRHAHVPCSHSSRASRSGSLLVWERLASVGSSRGTCCSVVTAGNTTYLKHPSTLHDAHTHALSLFTAVIWLFGLFIHTSNFGDSCQRESTTSILHHFRA